MTKKCSKCLQTKSQSQFNKHKWCKNCANQSSREWYYKNKEKAKQQHINFVNNNPDYYKTEEYKIAQNKRTKKWYLDNKEHRKMVGRIYYQNNKEKFKEAIYRRKAKIRNNGGNFKWADFIILCNKYNNQCLACGKIKIKLTPDHIIPLFIGGINSIENIQPLCLTCNISKGIKIIDYRKDIYALS